LVLPEPTAAVRQYGAGGVLLLRIANCALLDGVYQPDPFDSDGEIFSDLGLHARHSVFRRQNLDNQERWDRGNPIADVTVAPHRDIGDAKACGTDANPDRGKYFNPQPGANNTEQVYTFPCTSACGISPMFRSTTSPSRYSQSGPSKLVRRYSYTQIRAFVLMFATIRLYARSRFRLVHPALLNRFREFVHL